MSSAPTTREKIENLFKMLAGRDRPPQEPVSPSYGGDFASYVQQGAAAA